jgi:regulator of replication initiation timing
MKSLQRILPVISLLAACSLPPVEEDATSEALETTESQDAVIVEPEPWAPTTPAWEQRSFEGVIEPASPGEVTWSSWPTHESDAEPQGSRMFLLERYQEVVDERDSMAREIMGLKAMIDNMSGKITALEVDLGVVNTTCAERQTEITRLRDENTTLAERLTTAQIARLEAERILLEESIERIQIEALVNGAETANAPTVDVTQGTKQ